MIVKRIRDLDINNRDFITAIIGHIDDVFIDNDLCRYTFEEQLHLYLKNEGYKRIYFYSRAARRGLYTYDNRDTLEILYPNGMGNSNNQDGRPLGRGRLRSNSGNGNSGNGKSNSNIKEGTGNRSYYYVSNFKDNTLAETVIDILNSKEASIICFSSTKLEYEDEQGLIAGIEMVKSLAAQINSKNKILIISNARDKASFLNNLNHPNSQGIFNNNIFNNQFKTGDQLNPTNVFMVELPDLKECENWLNSMRIQGGLNNQSIFSFPYQTLVRQIAKDKKTIKALEIDLGSNANGFLESHEIEEFSEELLSRSLSKIHGQQDNMEVIVRKVVTWINRPDEAKMPLVFMFAGTSGTGKTYTAETINECLASQGFEFVKLDMNEYQSEADAWKLLGSATGFSGSENDAPLFAKRKQSERLVILFDEMEKAHESLFETIMTLMEKGKLANGRGEEFDFRQSIIIFTTNKAMDTLIRRKKELTKEGLKIDSYYYQQKIKDVLKKGGIKNEICGRINCVYVFNTLDCATVCKIAIEEIRKLGRTYGLQINNIPVKLLKEVSTQISESNEGARPIKNFIVDRLEYLLQNYKRTNYGENNNTATDIMNALPLHVVEINENYEIVDSDSNNMLSPEQIISQYPNLTKVSRTASFDVAQLTKALKAVKGQQDNLDLIIKETNTWLRKVTKRKPLVFMLAGTSGTGKTFTVETVCVALKDYKMVKLNMNEYQSGGDTWKLLGSATGHVGSDQESPIFAARQESEKLVILFDEIEKAHESLFTTIMTLMEKGEMANGRGDVLDFKQCIIFFTTNLAMNELLTLKKESIQNKVSPSSQKFQDMAKGILKSAGLRDEISGRLDWLLIYNTFGASTVAQICLDKIRSLGKDYGITINKVPQAYLERVAKLCAENNEGARPINRIVTSDFESVFQDAYEKGCISPDKICDINDHLEITPSKEYDITPIEDIKIKETKIESFDIEQLKEQLKAVKGQQDNMDLIVKETNTWLRKAKKRKPLVFMLAGTSGTGKTFTVETVCDALKDYKMVKLNMNEYQSKGDIWKLLGSATGHVGSDQESPIFTARRETEKLVILFDEVEKAHESLFTTIMTLMEKGEMANGRGRVSDFKHCIIFFTTNLAMRELLKFKKESIQNNILPSSHSFQDTAKGILKSAGLKDEISGRVNWVLVYNTLSASVVAQICLDKIRSLGKEYGIIINQVHQSYLEEVAKQCSGSNEGARPIDRIVTSDFEPIFQDLYENSRYNSDRPYDIDNQHHIIPSQNNSLMSVDEIEIENSTQTRNIKTNNTPIIYLSNEPFFQNGYNYDDYRKAMGLLKLGENGFGSGFIISSDGYIMTCAHCTNAERITFVKDNDKSEYDATVIYKNPDFDIAILKIDAHDMPYLTITDSNRPLKIGAEVVILGYPSGTDINVNVSAFEGKITNIDKARNAYQTDAIATHGSSGGAFISKKDGIVYGVLMAGYKDANINIATDIRNLLQKADTDISIEYI